MRELIKQLEDLKRSSERRHAATMAKISLLRAEHKYDYREMRETVRLLAYVVARLESDVQRIDTRTQSQMEGLEAALRSELDTSNDELTMLYSIVKSYLESELQKDERREDELQSCVNKIRCLELRIQEIESRQQPPAA